MNNASKDLNEAKTDLSKNVLSASFLLYVSAAAMFAGFGLTLARARKSSPKSFDSNSDGTKLAFKALGYGSLISVSACGLLVVFVAKAFGVKNSQEFGAKMKTIFPSKDGEFVRKFDNWPTKFPVKTDDGKWKEEFK
ncbi:transmembrane protein 242 isoform X1 [Hydra vulgaris]|uniref:Transmembrane protein 242 n=1 Tax=Hydra vulgaris TaxID=6087 RepID=T2M4F6_HYDVU|nr:transmembrane protein 242 [Hydra vulgaris]